MEFFNIVYSPEIKNYVEDFSFNCITSPLKYGQIWCKTVSSFVVV